MSTDVIALNKSALIQLADSYIAAVAARDYSGLPLSPEVKFTENGQRLGLGQALWATATGATDYRLTVADARTGQVCVLSMVLENDLPALLGVRLKTDGRGQITEIETLAGRRGHGTTDRPHRLGPVHPIFSEPLAPDERRSREEMIAIADSYFEGLVNPSVNPPFDERCDRVENGVQTTNLADPGAVWAAWSCERQYHAGFSRMVEANDDRRYQAVDEKSGLLYAMIIMQFTGSVRSVKISDGSTFVVPERYLEPRSVLAHEVFKITGGKIRMLESMYVALPYGSRSGW